MPYYTLVVKDRYNIPLRQFSGSREAVQFEYDSLSPIKWNTCTATWRTCKGRVVETKTFPGLKKEQRKSRKVDYYSQTPPKEKQNH